MFRKLCFGLAALIASFLTGCSTVESRIKSNPQIYASFSTADQALIRQGQGCAYRPSVSEHQRDCANRKQQAEIAEQRARYDSLTQREREVLALVLSGLLNRQIAAQLGTTEFTIKIQRRGVMQKMRAGSLAELVRIAEKLGILSSKD